MARVGEPLEVIEVEIIPQPMTEDAPAEAAPVKEEELEPATAN